MTDAATAAGTVAAIGVVTPVFSTLFAPVIFPVVVAAGALYAARIDERKPLPRSVRAPGELEARPRPCQDCWTRARSGPQGSSASR